MTSLKSHQYFEIARLYQIRAEKTQKIENIEEQITKIFQENSEEPVKKTEKSKVNPPQKNHSHGKESLEKQIRRILSKNGKRGASIKALALKLNQPEDTILNWFNATDLIDTGIKKLAENRYAKISKS